MKKEAIQRKKDYAKLLYTVEDVTVQKELADRVGVSAVTMNKWVKEEGWETRRANVIITKESELYRVYRQLTALNDHIESKPDGEQFANSKEADALVKYSATIRQLETDMSVADVIEVMKRFAIYIREDDYQKAKEISSLADSFIKSLIN